MITAADDVGVVTLESRRSDNGPRERYTSSTLQGYYLGQLLIGGLGVLFVSGEYSTGMIRSSLTAVPSWSPVLWAKLVAFVMVTAATMIVSCIIAFVLVLPVLLGNVLGAWGRDVAKFLPTVAGASIVQTIREANSLAPLTGLFSRPGRSSAPPSPPSGYVAATPET